MKYLKQIIKWILVLTLGLLFSSCRSNEDSGRRPESRDTIEFPEINSRLILEARAWGIAGNHEQTRIMPEGALSDSSNTQFFATAEIFYRKEGKNTLVIYAPSSSLINQLDSIGPVKIRIVPLLNRDSLVNLGRTYAGRGYMRLSAYDDESNQ